MFGGDRYRCHGADAPSVQSSQRYAVVDRGRLVDRPQSAQGHVLGVERRTVGSLRGRRRYRRRCNTIEGHGDLLHHRVYLRLCH